MRARRLRYTSGAVADLTRIRTYLRREASVRTAHRVVDQILKTVKNFRATPALGAPRPHISANCRFVRSKSYIIYYEFDGQEMVVLRILHKSQDREAIMRRLPPGS